VLPFFKVNIVYTAIVEVLKITFQAVAALLGIGVLGFWIIGRRHVPANVLAVLTSIAIDIAIPCLVLGNIVTEFSPQNYPGWWQLPLWWAGFTVVALALSLVTSFLVKREIRSEFRISLFFQNAIFFPLLIISGLFTNPAPYLIQLFLFIFLQPSLVFSVYPFFFSKKTSEQKLNWRRVLNPIMIVTLIGLFLGLVGIKDYVPKFVVMVLTMVGAMSVPLFMLILGGNVYNDFVSGGKEGKKFYWGEVIKFTLIKNLIFPMVFLGLLIWIKPSYIIAFMIILQAAIPPITAIPIFTERSGGNRPVTSQMLVASFVFSIISIPVSIYLFSLRFPFPAQ
jgi:predicted permease